MFLIIRRLVLLFLVLSFASCKKTFKPANEPFFITANQIKVKTLAGQGYGSHKITDLWLYTNGFFRGVYPVGSKMPIMSNGENVKIDLFAGIKNNGISETSVNWIFYDKIEFDTLVETGKDISRNFTFNYRSATTFTWVENFELPGYSLIKSPISDTTYKVHQNDADVFEGNKSIEFGLSGNTALVQLESATSFSLPLNSGNIYLEFDYKCNTTFKVDVISNGVNYEAIEGITPKDNWNHIYIQLSTAVSTDKNTAMKKIAFKLLRDKSIDNQKVYLDNIKLVYL